MEKFGRGDLYVDFVDVQSLPYGEARAFQKRYQDIDQDNPSLDQAEMAMEDVLKLIHIWHMTDPGTDELLPRPKHIDDLKGFPVEVLMHILNGCFGVTEAGKSEEIVPLGIETESAPTLEVQVSPSPSGSERLL
jgi:hypothetical protein